jgi:hypothetical protein
MTFFKLLTILFIGLKLAGFITWSWWLVLLPLYLPFTLGVVTILLASWVTGKKTRLTYKGKRIW